MENLLYNASMLGQCRLLHYYDARRCLGFVVKDIHGSLAHCNRKIFWHKLMQKRGQLDVRMKSSLWKAEGELILYKLLILLFLICSLLPTQGPKACTWYNLMSCLIEKCWFCDLQLADACVLCIFVSLVAIKSRCCYFSCLVYNPCMSLLAWI